MIEHYRYRKIYGACPHSYDCSIDTQSHTTHERTHHMPKDRGIGQYRPELVETEARTRYEAHHALEINDYLFGGLLSSGSFIEDLPKGEQTDILFENVAGSGTYYNVEPLYIVNGRSTVQKFLNVDVNTRGSEVEVAQQRSDFSNNTDNITVTVGSDVDATNARTFPKRLTSTAKDQGEIVHAESVLVAPGDNLCILVDNISSDVIDTTVYLRISPIPANLVDTLTEGPSG